MDGSTVAQSPQLSATEISKEELDRRLEAADDKIKRLAQNYNMVAADLFQEELKKFQEMATAEANEETRAAAIKSVFTVTHDMRGLSETFGYPLLGQISSACADFIDSREGPVSVTELEVIRLHLSSLIVVAKQNMKGDGGEAGRMLNEQLVAAVKAMNK
ncbi:MAG: hypothetical protein CMM52_01695 [Rhodospirillaceae bacterium]|nr:hypothetical protein [Rhodospirillaceae bacterium]|tara:strand:+ start:22464 stop:22943 length:480 start_codon:yes stop_codon:yes gene_type:complete